jgi:MacB-like periplasmic core domain
MLPHLRQAVRSLLKSPGFTVMTILVLGFGIGANTAIFSFINGVVLKPLPYANPNRLVLIVQTFRNLDTVPLNYADYVDFKGAQHSFSDMGVSTQNNFTLTGQGDPERINGLYVDASFFSVLDRPFVAGRPFGHRADSPDSSSVVVISEHLWRTRFRSDPQILGRNLILDRKTFQVVGVTSGQADETGRANLYVPVSSAPLFNQYQSVRVFYNFLCYGRLKPGFTLGQARADLTVINQELIARYPATHAGFGVRLASFISPDYLRALQILLLHGRMFDRSDLADKGKVVIISESMADRYFSGQDPVGKQIHDLNDLGGSKRNYYTIVGVVADVQLDSPEAQPSSFQAYFPYSEDPTTPPVSVNGAR